MCINAPEGCQRGATRDARTKYRRRRAASACPAGARGTKCEIIWGGRRTRAYPVPTVPRPPTRYVRKYTHITYKHKPHGIRGSRPGLRRSRPSPPSSPPLRTSTRPTAGGQSPLSRSTRSCRAVRGDAPPPPPSSSRPSSSSCGRAPRPAPRRRPTVIYVSRKSRSESLMTSPRAPRQ